MGRVTSKLQVTVPKAIADRYRIRPGTELQWLPAGESLRVVTDAQPPEVDVAERLRLFDAATARHAKRKAGRRRSPAKGRGWTREDLYDRGLPR
jgi:bifunctional DNA-binding transcriptional regulator/antitoxin component of YhaV-PrlF toxin-antitoxin module